MGDTPANALPRRARTVRDDWNATLEPGAQRLFDDLHHVLSGSFYALSVALNEALALRADGNLCCARRQAENSSELFSRFARRLLALLSGIERHAKHFGTIPNVQSLDPLNFRGRTARYVARMNALLSVIFSQRRRFFLKLSDLADLVLHLEEEFCQTAESVLEGTSLHPNEDWLNLDALQYDVNTCFCETLVVLKSCLCGLPDRELQALRVIIAATPPPPPRSRRTQVPVQSRRKTRF